METGKGPCADLVRRRERLMRLATLGNLLFASDSLMSGRGMGEFL